MTRGFHALGASLKGRTRIRSAYAPPPPAHDLYQPWTQSPIVHTAANTNSRISSLSSRASYPSPTSSTPIVTSSTNGPSAHAFLAYPASPNAHPSFSLCRPHLSFLVRAVFFPVRDGSPPLQFFAIGICARRAASRRGNRLQAVSPS